MLGPLLCLILPTSDSSLLQTSRLDSVTLEDFSNLIDSVLWCSYALLLWGIPVSARRSSCWDLASLPDPHCAELSGTALCARRTRAVLPFRLSLPLVCVGMWVPSGKASRIPWSWFCFEQGEWARSYSGVILKLGCSMI